MGIVSQALSRKAVELKNTALYEVVHRLEDRRQLDRESRAATTLQAHWRGKDTRRKLARAVSVLVSHGVLAHPYHLTLSAYQMTKHFGDMLLKPIRVSHT